MCLCIIAPEGGYCAGGLDVRPVSSICPFVCVGFLEPLFGHLHPYLVPESAFVLVRFWVILAQRTKGSE